MQLAEIEDQATNYTSTSGEKIEKNLYVVAIDSHTSETGMCRTNGVDGTVCDSADCSPHGRQQDVVASV